jgi:DNA-binding PadR family transcriptional regulator
LLYTAVASVAALNSELHPYVVFLPSDLKTKILTGIFGSKVAVDVLKFSLHQGIENKIYQKDLVKKLNYSNKTVIQSLKKLAKLGVLEEEMEKAQVNRRTVWVKTYQLSDSGRWFAMLLAEEKDLSQKEKSDILLDLFRAYVRWARSLSDDLHIERKALTQAFQEEMQ